MLGAPGLSSYQWIGPLTQRPQMKLARKEVTFSVFFFVKNSKNRLFLKISLCAAYGSYIEYVGLIGTANIKGF